MGMSVDRLLYLQAKGALLPGKVKLLDFGPQNVYHAKPEQIRAFVKAQGQRVSDEELDREIERLVYFSTPRPGERTTFVSEITDLTNLEYNSYDICPGLKTDILDLNFDDTPPHHRNAYDVVLNFGTTEHVFNQWNSFKIIHETTKVGGYIYYQLPGTAYLDHGYYCYTPVFFKDMAEANGYEVIELFFTDAGMNDLKAMKFDIRDNDRYMEPYSASMPDSRTTLTCFNIHVLVRKTQDSHFRCGAEIATAHSPIDARIRANYEVGAHQMDELGRLQAEVARLRQQVGAPQTGGAPVPTAQAASSQPDAARLQSEWQQMVMGKVEGLLEEVADLKERLSGVESELTSSRGLLDATLNSTSWKITKPLRDVADSVRGKKA